MPGLAKTSAQSQPMGDEEVVACVLAGDVAMFEIIMRRHNQRIYRAARAILRNEDEAEDVMQDTYVRAYEHLTQFAGKAKFSTWLTRIAVHESLARRKRANHYQEADSVFEEEGDFMDKFASSERTPEQQASNSELRTALEEAISNLPDTYQSVFILRDVEEMDTADTAYALNISEENVKVRLHRARALLRKSLYSIVEMERKEVFSFNAVRCDRVVNNVFARISFKGSPAQDAATEMQESDAL